VDIEGERLTRHLIAEQLPPPARAEDALAGRAADTH
jgi:hypothetical protein